MQYITTNNILQVINLYEKTLLVFMKLSGDERLALRSLFVIS